jgi:hypothetical protein
MALERLEIKTETDGSIGATRKIINEPHQERLNSDALGPVHVVFEPPHSVTYRYGEEVTGRNERLIGERPLKKGKINRDPLNIMSGDEGNIVGIRWVAQDKEF